MFIALQLGPLMPKKGPRELFLSGGGGEARTRVHGTNAEPFSIHSPHKK